MQYLSENWMVEPVFDYEYKTYQVLGYVKNLASHFEEVRLYPYLSDLHRHLELLETYDNRKESLWESLRRELLKINLKTAETVRKEVADENGVVAMIDEVLDFAKAHFQREYNRAVECKRRVRKEINISPVGILGDENSGGLLLFKRLSATRVYEYQFRFIRRPFGREAHKDVQTMFMDEVSTGLLPDFTAIKGRYLRRAQSPVGVNAFLVETNLPVPQFETLMPMVKEFLLGQE